MEIIVNEFWIGGNESRGEKLGLLELLGANTEGLAAF
jgi:hypothetical protein